MAAPHGDEPSADRGADHARGGRSDELVQRVRLVQVGARDELRDDRIEGRAEERGAGAEGRRDDQDVPELEGRR